MSDAARALSALNHIDPGLPIDQWHAAGRAAIAAGCARVRPGDSSLIFALPWRIGAAMPLASNPGRLVAQHCTCGCAGVCWTCRSWSRLLIRIAARRASWEQL